MKSNRSNQFLQRLLRRELIVLAMLAGSASCVPAGTAARPAEASAALALDLPPLATLAPPPAPESIAPPSLPLDKAAALNSAIPVTGSGPAARSTVFRARTGLDQLRALDCLAQTIYYEARSESEAGQRAVAQVVLNRVRHPAYPNSVCGVVYQGPMRAGGGCQFTFTCDGSLASRPLEPLWSRARQLAAEALAGKVFAPVGHATHYHTYAVHPHWASSLAKTAVIGAHIFYRWGNGWGQPAAFRAPYAGTEPIPRPTLLRVAMAARTPILPVQSGALFQPMLPPAPTGSVAALAEDAVTAPANNLPQSTIRAEYANSGRPRDVPLD